MKTATSVSIATSLDLNKASEMQKGGYVCILDLRCCEKLRATPIEEHTLKTLANFHIQYKQLPMDLYSRSIRDEKRLNYEIALQRGKVLVITSEPAQLVRICHKYDIPFFSKEKLIVEDGEFYTPIQVKQKTTGNAQYGSFSG